VLNLENNHTNPDLSNAVNHDKIVWYKKEIFKQTGLYFPTFGPQQSEFIVASRIKELRFPDNIYVPENYEYIC
jgi:hypothetical protein